MLGRAWNRHEPATDGARRRADHSAVFESKQRTFQVVSSALKIRAEMGGGSVGLVFYAEKRDAHPTSRTPSGLPVLLFAHKAEGRELKAP